MATKNVSAQPSLPGAPSRPGHERDEHEKCWQADDPEQGCSHGPKNSASLADPLVTKGCEGSADGQEGWQGEEEQG
jgi:hypothetical protein